MTTTGTTLSWPMISFAAKATTTSRPPGRLCQQQHYPTNPQRSAHEKLKMGTRRSAATTLSRAAEVHPVNAPQPLQRSDKIHTRDGTHGVHDTNNACPTKQRPELGCCSLPLYRRGIPTLCRPGFCQRVATVCSCTRWRTGLLCGVSAAGGPPRRSSTGTWAGCA